MSQRTNIRTAFATAITGLPSLGHRVFVSRTRQLRDNELPAALVFSGETEFDTEVVGLQHPVLAFYKLRVDILVKQSGGEDIADQILDEISGVVFASIEANTLGGQITGLRLSGVGEPDLDDSLDTPALRLPVVFETTYSIEE